MSDMEIVRLHLARIDALNHIPVHGFVIKHPRAGAILVDTGVGWPDDIGPLAAFLCSDGASYITGQIIWVDGGMTSRLGLGRARPRAEQ